MDKKPVSHSDIRIRVGLDEKKWPVSIEWVAPGQEEMQPSKAMLLSLFDSASKETLRMDLWTHEMQIMEMDRLIYHTIKGLAETYFKSTSNKEMTIAMQQFAQYFGEKTGIVPPLPNKP